jgi:MFS family permease
MKTAFYKLWAGQTISLFGSQITFLALPLVAALTLQATAFEMGLLAAVGTLPALLIALPGGVFIDRVDRRRVLIICDIARAGLLLLIPLAAWWGWLSFGLLLAVSFATGAFNVLFSIAYRAILPSLVSQEQLVEGNSKLEISQSAAEIGGPGLAGLLVQLLTAPIAILFDAMSYLVSAFFIGSIQSVKTIAERNAAPQVSFWQELKVGLGVVRRHVTLRILAIAATGISLFNHLLEAVWVLYAVRDLGVAPGWLGVIFGAGNIGFLLGALAAQKVTRYLGVSKATGVALLLAAFGDGFIVLAAGDIFTVVSLLLIAQFLFGCGLTVYNINAVSLRQTAAPEEVQGRVNSVFTFASQGIAPVGALLGGWLGTGLDLRLALLIAVVGEITIALWVLRALTAVSK